ncbi:hypothetical protein IAU59_006642 [Kwoniella sp. CBS 9459]
MTTSTGAAILLILPLIAAAPLPSDPSSDSLTPAPASSSGFSPSTSASMTSTSVGANNTPDLSTSGAMRTVSAPMITASPTSTSTGSADARPTAAGVSAMEANGWDMPWPTAASGWDNPSAPPSPEGDTTTMVPVLIEPNSETSTITIGPASAASPTPVASWSLPPDFSDMSPFHVKTYAAGKSNLAILSGSPAPFNSTSAGAETDGPTPADPWDPTTNALQILYPSGSINPGNKPQGGSEFYADPLDLTKATNASLQYSVYFPHDFDFVKGGKLPGLYGGHKGCSGGNAAEDCFSTRLMWRAGGLGELYLYAPKDKQTPELCQTKPRSVCDAAYGLSIGRGAWKFALGDWTTVRQDVWLNTPGQNDGGFNIWVNGQLVLSASDVRYRENPDACLQGESSDADGSVDAAQVPTINAIGMSGDQHPHNGSTSSSSSSSGGIVDEDWQIAEEMVGPSTITHYSTRMATITMTATMPLATEYTTFAPSSPPQASSTASTSASGSSSTDLRLTSTSSASTSAAPSGTASIRRRQDEAVDGTADASEATATNEEDASHISAASNLDANGDPVSATDSAAPVIETVTASASLVTLVSSTTAFVTVPVTATATTTATVDTDQPLVLAAPTQYSTLTVTQTQIATPTSMVIPMGDSLAWPTLEAAAMPVPAPPASSASPSSIMSNGPIILHPDPAIIHMADILSDDSEDAVSTTVDHPTQPSATLQPIVVKPPPAIKIASNEPALSSDQSAQGAGPGCGVGFTGLFFSTFFGGHTSDWASPKDQYTYFKDFKVWVNN